MSAYKDFYAGDPYFHLCARFSRVSFGDKMTQFDRPDYWAERFGYGERLYRAHLEGRLGPGDVVFDFGCGDGAWLWALRELSGCDVDGEEISDVYAGVVRERLGIDPFLGPIEEVGPAIIEKHQGRVKLAIVSGSLQHMLDPMRCLEVASRILRADGLLFVCNWSLFEHFMAPYSGDPERHLGATQRLLGENLSWEHPHYFHETSFRFMLEHAGFEILDFQIDSRIRLRHMDALARRAATAVPASPRRTAADVVARLRALESATIALKIRVIP